MKFRRKWDLSCPRKWDSWATKGVKWTICDLRQEDDEEAIKLLVEHFCPDETLRHLSDFVNAISMKYANIRWQSFLAQRMSLGCYQEKNGSCKLVGVNVCIVLYEGEEFSDTTMPFLRNWDSCCPHVWDRWEADGINWTIRDIPPEDKDEAVEILMKHQSPDEIFYSINDTINDTISMEALKAFWRKHLNQRMSIGCYQEADGKRNLVGLIVCTVLCQGDKVLDEVNVEGKAWKNAYNAMKLCDSKVDALKILDIDMMLYAMGLAVHVDHQGAGLVSRLLIAIESLGLHHCVKGALIIFTAAESQKSAERVGFTTAATVTFKDLADAGLEYPKEETTIMKVMIKKFAYTVESEYSNL